MLAAFALLLAAQLAGEILRSALHLPLPGPVIGMALLAALRTLRRPAGDAGAAAAPLDALAGALIANMGLLFVPAGVGIVAQAGLLRQHWAPLLAGLLVSTVLGLLVTGLVMHHVLRRAEAAAVDGAAGAAPGEAS